MPIAVGCACGAKLNAKEALAGKKVRCPKCAAVLEVPTSTARAPVPAPAARKCLYCGKPRPAAPGPCPECGRGAKPASARKGPPVSAASLRRVALRQEQVEARVEPAADAPVLTKLKNGAQFFLGEPTPDGGWLHVRTITMKDGYVPAGTGVAEMETETEEGDAFSLEKKGIRMGVLGGLIMMAIAVAWFVIGWAAGYIFFYPPILFVIGVIALVKGLLTGNVAGKKDA